MDLPFEVREQFRRQGRRGGKMRAANMTPTARAAGARRAVTARWLKARFGAADLRSTGLPAGDLVQKGLDDLTEGVTTPESLLVSLGARRLRREGVPVSVVEPDPEQRLYERLAGDHGDFAHARYKALRNQLVSFANACPLARVDR